MTKHRLSETPLHLGLGATALVQPPFDGIEWYEAYGKRNEKDGVEGRLVSMHTFSKPWDTWEMHPQGHEVVLCVSGEITLVQEIEGKESRVTLQAGECAINDPGVWHTADIKGSATAVFITAGTGTEIRDRS
ncbi:MAG: cupin domain-containing protein [Myxococcota bacterium]